jgi:hypothetical protein
MHAASGDDIVHETLAFSASATIGNSTSTQLRQVPRVESDSLKHGVLVILSNGLFCNRLTHHSQLRRYTLSQVEIIKCRQYSDPDRLQDLALLRSIADYAVHNL